MHPPVQSVAPLYVPDQSRAWYLRAVVAEEHGDVEEAHRAWGWAVRMDRGSAWLHLARARFLVRQGELAGADAACLDAQELDPDLPDAALLRAEILVARNRPDEARLLFASACEAGSEAACEQVRHAHEVP